MKECQIAIREFSTVRYDIILLQTVFFAINHNIYTILDMRIKSLYVLVKKHGLF